MIYHKFWDNILLQVLFYHFFFTLKNIIRAGKPPNGLHLDVMKEGKMIQVEIKTNELINYWNELFILIEINDWWK